MTPDQAAALNGAARVRQLIDLTQRLTARLAAELGAFEARRPQELLVGMAETQELANLYRRESAQLKADPSALRAAPESDRTLLRKATRTFEAILTRHGHAVEAARVVSEGLVKAIAGEVAQVRGSPTGYGASGRAAAGDARAVALNRTA